MLPGVIPDAFPSRRPRAREGAADATCAGIAPPRTPARGSRKRRGCAIDRARASGQGKHRPALKAEGFRIVANPELGTKRLCGGCGAKFYDLSKDPIVCPKCSTVFVIAPTSSRSRPGAAPRAPVVEEEVAAPEAAEFVSLEDADKEAEGAKPGGVEGGDDEV